MKLLLLAIPLLAAACLTLGIAGCNTETSSHGAYYSNTPHNQNQNGSEDNIDPNSPSSGTSNPGGGGGGAGH